MSAFESDNPQLAPANLGQISRVEANIEQVLRQLSRLEVLERRLEEAIGYFAIRINQLVGSQSIYLGDHTAVTFLQNGLRILADTRSMDVGIHLLTLGTWEANYMNIFGKLLKPGDTVLDIGANHGVYALHAALAVGPKGRVHAFEPNPRLARLVDFSLRLNGFGEYAVLHPVGVSDANRKARLSFSNAFSGGGAIVRDQSGTDDQGVECDLISLDSFFTDPGFKVDIIKMDIEGHEGLAIRGMQTLLERSPDVKILMEFSSEMMARAGVSAEGTTRLLADLGFMIWLITDDGALAAASPKDLLDSRTNIQNILVARELPKIFD